MTSSRVQKTIGAWGLIASLASASGNTAFADGSPRSGWDAKCPAGDADCRGEAEPLEGSNLRAGGLVEASSPPSDDPAAKVETERSSPAYALPLLGAYRKTMEIEREIARACETHGVPLPLARAVCMYESGGDDRLTSGAGAHGYFQVMPSTFRLMKVATNIEAGVKYLGSLLRQFGREDDALAAYNGGPGRVKRGRPMPIESLQYVVGVGIYRTLLSREDTAIRAAASQLGLYKIEQRDTWESIIAKTKTPLVNLRLYNPYIASRPLSQGAVLAYPSDEPEPVFSVPEEGTVSGPVYVTRRGDNYLLLAFAFDVDLDTFRKDNTLWRIQPPFEGMRLLINARNPAASQLMLGDPRRALNGRFLDGGDNTAAGIDLDRPGAGVPDSLDALDSRSHPTGRPASNRATTHRVRPGDTLHRIAGLYGVSVESLRKANSLRRSHLRAGQVLKIPAA